MPYKQLEDRRAAACRYQATEKSKARRRQWNEQNADRLKEKRWRKQGFVLTVTGYKALLEGQDGKCAICRRDSLEFTKALAADHDHKTGMVRGLLCVVCNNKVLPVLEHHSDLIPKAVQYLKRI